MNLRLCLLLAIASCATPEQPESDEVGADGACVEWALPKTTGTLEPAELDEASGLAASRLHDDVYFTHNDSGGEPEVFAVRSDGSLVARWLVAGQVNRDWEAIAAGPCPAGGGACLYIGDTGDNLVAQESVKLVVVREPEDLASTQPLQPLAVLDLRYDEGARDVEALFVDAEGDVYLVDKYGSDGKRGVFRVPASAFGASSFTASRFATLAIPGASDGLVTDADLHPTRVAILVRTYWSVLLFEGDTIKEALESEALFIEGGEFGFEPQGEAIAWSKDGLKFFTTSEERHANVSEWACAR